MIKETNNSNASECALASIAVVGFSIILARFPALSRMKRMEEKKAPYTTVKRVARTASHNMPEGKLIGKRAKVGDLSMFYRVSIDPVPAGQPPVVMVHGYVVSGRYMKPTGRLLAPFYRVYIPDLPGFGESDNPRHTLNTTELTDALAAWMQALELKQAVLVGNSYGCQIITDLALRYPELVRSAVLVGPTVNPRARNLFLLAISWAVAMMQEPLPLIAICILNLFQFGLKRAIATMRAMLADNIAHRLPDIHVPVLLVRGSRDTIVPQRWAEQAAALLPHGELVVIKGGIHATNYDSPATLSQIIRSFLTESRWQ